MSTAAASATLTVALIGNPNTGKSTLFTALAGVRQRVGNYPGVTVEKKIGYMQHGGKRFALVDLPGTYSLAPRSPDEMVAVDVLLARRTDTPPPDVVLCIVDANNLERNLYLVSQVLELGRPTVVALNMFDVAERNGLGIDVRRLADQLGVPVVPIQANRHRGLDELKAAIVTAVDQTLVPPATNCFPPQFCEEVSRLEALLCNANENQRSLPRYLVERLLLDSDGYLERATLHGAARALGPELAASRVRLRTAGTPVPAVEAIARYDWIARKLGGVVTRPASRAETASDRVDRILTHRIWGTSTFVLVMILLFSSIFVAADPLMNLIDGSFGLLGERVESLMPEGALRSLLVDGVIGGVGGVLVFLPQILILFFFIALLEDCGYMARAAYLMDKLMSRVGLSGKSFIPLLSSFACAIPGVMATRVIENRRDRLTTILVAPLMSCAARLPVYTILIAAFIPAVTLVGWTFTWQGERYEVTLLGLQGLTMVAMYLVGVLAAVAVAAILKKTLLRGETPPFVMELPPYKVPSPTIVLYRMMDRGWAFVRRAGTVILAATIVIWAASYYPRDEAVEAPFLPRIASIEAQLAELDSQPLHASSLADQQAHEMQRARLVEQRDELSHQIDGEYQRQSYLGRAGRWIEPVVRPLGWDWRIGSAAIASFPAREVVIGALGVIYNLGEIDAGQEQGRTQLQAQLRAARWDGTDRPVYNIPVALSIMVFFALCAQCAATLAVIKRETNSWAWPAFTFVYMTALAYLAALITYQTGMWLSQ